jgi:dipeptidyl aminopeptidase/acylaminoacyl peptidase
MKQNCRIIDRFGEKLETVIRKPDDNGRFPTVLFVAGIGATLHETDNSHDEIAQRLADNGFLTVQFSFAGRGKSEGDYGKMTMDRQGKQIEDVLNWLQEHPSVDVKRIGIYAMSFGVPSTLSADISSVRSLCLVSGAYFPYEAMEQMFRLKGEYNPQGESWRKFSTGEIFRVGSDFWVSLRQFDQTQSVQSLTQPVLVIHGDKDIKISIPDVKKIYAAVGSKTKKIRIFPGGDHGMLDVPKKMREEFLVTVVEWFKETL